MVATARGLSSAAGRRSSADAVAAGARGLQSLRMANCSHIDQLREVPAQSSRCEECVKAGQQWVALRKCLSCGHVGCCDSTPGRHARAHFHQSKHPLIEPLGGKQWTWCYADDTYVKRA